MKKLRNMNRSDKIRAFRRMWRGMAEDEQLLSLSNLTLAKHIYMIKNVVAFKDRPIADCYLCEILGECCAVVWLTKSVIHPPCSESISPYTKLFYKWDKLTIGERSELCREISELPLARNHNYGYNIVKDTKIKTKTKTKMNKRRSLE